MIHHQILLLGVLQRQPAQRRNILVGVRDAVLHADAAAGDKRLIHKIPLQAAHGPVPGKAHGRAGKLPADEEQVDRLGGRQDIGDLQRGGQHGQLPVRDLAGNEPGGGGAVQIDKIPRLDQRVALLGDDLFFRRFQNLSRGDVDIILYAFQDVGASMSPDQLSVLLHGPQIPTDGLFGHIKPGRQVRNGHAFSLLELFPNRISAGNR